MTTPIGRLRFTFRWRACSLLTFIYQHMEMRPKEGISSIRCTGLPQGLSSPPTKRASRRHGWRRCLRCSSWVLGCPRQQADSTIRAARSGSRLAGRRATAAFLPSFDGPGVLVQMVHQLRRSWSSGWCSLRGLRAVRSEARTHDATPAFGRITDITAGFWMLNVMIGGSYIIAAKVDNFPEWVSLLHLVVGVTGLLIASTALFSMYISDSKMADHSEEA